MHLQSQINKHALYVIAVLYAKSIEKQKYFLYQIHVYQQLFVHFEVNLYFGLQIDTHWFLF